MFLIIELLRLFVRFFVPPKPTDPKHWQRDPREANRNRDEINRRKHR